MTPTLPDILTGQFLSLSSPQPPEAGDDYIAGRMGLLAMLALLAAQEAERGPAARAWENGAIRALLAKVGADGPDPGDGDGAWSALDAANAALRRRLIDLHEAVEARGEAALDAEILALYLDMAKARRLDLPAAVGG